MPEISVQTDETSETLKKHKPGSVTLQIPRWIFWGSSLLVGLLSVYAAGTWTLKYYGPFMLAPPDVMEDVGLDGIMIFRKHDRDDDGVLTLEEFEPLVHRLKEVNETTQYHQEIKHNDEIITIETKFQPFQLKSMNKDLNELFSGNLDSLFGLKTWKSESTIWKNYAARHFSVFLPPKEEFHNLGKVYHIYDLMVGPDEPEVMSSNRYYPPTVDKKLVTIHQLLAMFHPRPFIYSRFMPQGAQACVRAYNEYFVDIEFRIHAEFQLNEPPFYPFWFTPAQFRGNIIISRDGKHVEYFHMAVPTDKKLNVDMEWLNPRDGSEDQNMEVDIGFIPQMELSSTDKSQFINSNLSSDARLSFISRNSEHSAMAASIPWTEEISVEQARKYIEVRFYPFKRVLEKDITQPKNAIRAQLHMKSYVFPVMMIVALPNGTVVNAVNANEFMEKGDNLSDKEVGFDIPNNVLYLDFLRDSYKIFEEKYEKELR